MKKTDEKIVKTSFSFKLILTMVALLIMLPEITMSEDHQQNREDVEAHRHRLELFLGNTHEDGEDAFTSGLFYEYRLSEVFGIGGFWEYAAGDFDKWSAGIPLYNPSLQGVPVHPGTRFGT